MKTGQAPSLLQMSGGGALRLRIYRRLVAHPEARAEMFGEQRYRRTIAARVALCQVLHRFDQQALAFEIPGVAGAFVFLLHTRKMWNDEDLGHGSPGKNLVCRTCMRPC